ncbi:uncharacterized protein CG3556-like [Pollicipes pollicipes]|uniref:uncharacterized protein CG3556-like n=1 Tax=Pollicipes pollicipes TaxID=41117 RepID=UPI00188516B6|nr:uncharacterized protein CG3556-like [Pollicipes pollicipes]
MKYLWAFGIAVVLAMPALGQSDGQSAPTAPEVDEQSHRPVHFTYWLWVGTEVNETFNLSLTVPPHTSMFKCMKLAARRDSHYEFTKVDFSFGHYIDSIGGYHEQKDNSIFWMLYRLPSPPDRNNKPDDSALTPKGVDGVFPRNGDHILFWYKEVDLSTHQ